MTLYKTRDNGQGSLITNIPFEMMQESADKEGVSVKDFSELQTSELTSEEVRDAINRRLFTQTVELES